jgi:hypothetical protein
MARDDTTELELSSKLRTPSGTVTNVSAWALATGLLAIVTVAFAGRLAVAAGIVLVVIVSLPQLSRLRRDPLDAPALYVASSAFLFGVISVSWLGSPSSPPPGVTRADVTLALELVAVALLCFTVGTLVAGKAESRKAPVPGNERIHSERLILGIFIVGLAIAGVGFGAGLTGYSTDVTAPQGVSAATEPIILFSGIAPLAVLCAAVIHFHRPSLVSRRTLAVLCVMQMIAGFGAGFKAQVILPVVYLILAYTGAKCRIPWRAGLATCIGLIFVVLPLVNGLRTQLRYGETGIGAVAHTLSNADSLRPDRAFRESEQYLTPRLRHIDQIALIVRDTPRTYPFAGGNSYTPALLLQAVPRAIWPKKPVLNQASQYAHTYWQIPQEQVTATPMTQLGDLYRNFGWRGTFSGAFVLGLVFGSYQRLASRRKTLRAEVIHVFILANFVAFLRIETEVPVLMGAFVKTFPLALGVTFLVFPISGQLAREWVARHRLRLAMGVVLAGIALGLAVLDGPLAKARPSLAPPQTVATVLRSHGLTRLRQVTTPGTSAALPNLRGAYEAQIDATPVLILDFETPQATVQVTGRARRPQPGVLIQGNMVAVYKPTDLKPRGLRILRSTLRAAA